MRAADGTLTASDGAPVQSGGGTIRLGRGDVRIGEDGTVFSGNEMVGSIDVVEFGPDVQLTKEGTVRFVAPEGETPDPSEATVRQRALEESNVSLFERLAEMTTVSRDFESLQRAIQMMMTDIDGRTITELGRR